MKTGLPDYKHSAHKTTVYGRCKIFKNKRSDIPSLHCTTGTAITDQQKANILDESILENFTENERHNNDFDEEDEIVNNTVKAFISHLPPLLKRLIPLRLFLTLKVLMLKRHQKAFDRVWLTGLTFKLITYNIPPPLICLLHSYNSDRSYQVRVKDTLSNTKNICCGVAQGSLLGPLLFNLYINDIPDYSLTKLNMFADDTAVHTTYKRISSVTYALNKHLKLLEKYYDQWKISINVEKSAAIIFTKKRKLPPPPTMYNTTIPWSQSTKYLGIIFDKNLTWRTHIQHAK
ncbi:probable RNA-directed DNA polymerase from transposon X-element [Trichonephila clavipes]|nr:probable RNA-directed DNA polymerase from transposon X-element [Trichonephila clavipes]